MPHASQIIAGLRDQIARIDGRARRKSAALPFGIPELDRALPEGGLALGAIHEVAGGGAGTVDGAAAALFCAGIAARTKGKVIWCMTRRDLFFPALAGVGLHPDRVIFVEADREEDVLSNVEECLAFGGLGAVVGELVRLPMVASRRFQLAAEKSGTLGLIARRWRRQSEASDYGQPSAAVSRWRVSVSPSEPLPVPGVGRARWLVELLRVRAGECAEFSVGACDDKGRLCLFPEMGDGQDQEIGRRRYTGSR